MKRSQKFFTVGVVTLMLGAGVVAAWVWQRHQSPRATPATASTTKPAAVTPDPLSIAAIRAHPVHAGPVETTQTLAARAGCATAVVSFQSDGLTEYALMSTPATGRPAGGYPVVILAHGYINPASYQTTGSDYQGFINALCAAGYVVLKLDYRGNGSSGGQPAVGDLEPGYTYDLLDLTASLPNLTGVNAHKVAWLGHSMGGAVVLRAAVADHGLPVKAIVLASGVVDSLASIVDNWPPAMLPADLAPLKQMLTAVYGTPEANPTFYHDVSAINYVSEVHAPFEITHGTADEVVPILFSQHLDSALTAAGVAHVFYQYPGGDHQYSVPAVRSQFLTNTINFLNLHL